jgi:predicted DCC family thiol-disulfide oxidoreductase YuxK
VRQAPAGTSAPWTVLYDADCGLCIWLLAALLRLDTAGNLEPIALQDTRAARALADLTHQQRMASWHLLAPSGERWSAGAALPPLLRLLPHGLIPAIMASVSPHLTERVYRWVAAHRTQLSRLVPARAKANARRAVAARQAPVAEG